MLKDRLVLKDGTEIIGGFVSKSSTNQLMVRVPGNNIIEAAINFGDPNKTSEIVCYNSIYKFTYVGYTDMYSVQYFSDDNYVELWLAPVEGTQTSTNKEIVVPLEYVPSEMKEGTEDA